MFTPHFFFFFYFNTLARCQSYATISNAQRGTKSQQQIKGIFAQQFFFIKIKETTTTTTEKNWYDIIDSTFSLLDGTLTNFFFLAISHNSNKSVNEHTMCITVHATAESIEPRYILSLNGIRIIFWLAQYTNYLPMSPIEMWITVCMMKMCVAWMCECYTEQSQQFMCTCWDLFSYNPNQSQINFNLLINRFLRDFAISKTGRKINRLGFFDCILNRVFSYSNYNQFGINTLFKNFTYKTLRP